MAETKTTMDADDRRPRKAEETWIAIGPFTRVGKGALAAAIVTLFLLGVGIWWELRGIHREQERIRVGQELRGEPPGKGK